MARKTLFTMKVNTEERELIARLATQEQRSASDAIRLLIRRAVKERAPEHRDGALALSRP